MSIQYLQYRTKQGDMWDYLAWRFYNDESRLEVLVAANPHVPITPILPMGIVIAIPILGELRPTLNNAQLPPWRKK
jgi:phage tail protein X